MNQHGPAQHADNACLCGQPWPHAVEFPKLDGMRIIAKADDAVYLRLPRELQVPIDLCDCTYCKAHPDEPPMWDTLAIPYSTDPRNYSWTVHAPEWSVIKPYEFPSQKKQQGK